MSLLILMIKVTKISNLPSYVLSHANIDETSTFQTHVLQLVNQVHLNLLLQLQIIHHLILSNIVPLNLLFPMFFLSHLVIFVFIILFCECYHTFI
jgi:hypothetical protein